MPGQEIIVRGRVQGVGFRWFVLDCALRCDVKGYVKNLPDGSVKIIAVGKPDNLLLFSEEVKQGNRHSGVDKVEITELTQYHEYEEFFIA